MKEFIEKLHQELAEELAIYADLGALPVKRLSGALNATSAALQKIREYIETHPFENRQQEINFFKYLKPPVMAEKLYALEIYTIETNRPLVGDSDECDHTISAQADHPFRGKLTRAFRGKLTT